ncbi:hypothetical protein CcI156_03380 [Frankia sp. CcI156]|jgi:hypothetical protein|nr:hypothetical protein Manayef4_04805 [Frankia sp. CgIM4]ONH29389.1 hypothetical protein CcI156_03380 [Frankia sp. CcI156]ORT56972.1 hypothetical protein KBI5_00055 [Frankia sp. KB5]
MVNRLDKSVYRRFLNGRRCTSASGVGLKTVDRIAPRAAHEHLRTDLYQAAAQIFVDLVEYTDSPRA